MRTNAKGIIALPLAVLAISVMATELPAQSIANQPIKGNCISIEAFKIDWVNRDNVSFSTSTWFVTGQYQASPTILLVGEIPYSRFGTKNSSSFSSPLSESVIGNPYFGFIYHAKNSGFVSEVGVRLPITSSENGLASVGGILADFDRAESFFSEVLSIRTRFGGEFVSSTNDVRVRFLAGPTAWIPTSSGSPELLADLLASVWYQTGAFGIGANASGRYLVTEEGPSFSERSEFQIGLGANGTFGNVRPGLHVHIPLTNEGMVGLGTDVNAVYGFNLSFIIN